MGEILSSENRQDRETAPRTLEELNVGVISWDLASGELNNVGDRHVDPEQETYVITHGFTSNGNANWIREMAEAIRDRDPEANIVVLDWGSGSGARGTDFNRVTLNIPEVGADLAEYLQDRRVDPSGTTIIGHSLGAHVAGIAGAVYQERTDQQIGEIVSLDAAGSDIPTTIDHEDLPSWLRLDRSDAQRVINFQTTDLLGIEGEVGHLDIIIEPPGLLPDPAGDHSFPTELYTRLLRGEEFENEGRGFNLESLQTLQGRQEVEIRGREVRRSEAPQPIETAGVPSDGYIRISGHLSEHFPGFDDLSSQAQDLEIAKLMMRSELETEPIAEILSQGPIVRYLHEEFDRDSVVRYISETIDRGSQELREAGHEVQL